MVEKSIEDFRDEAPIALIGILEPPAQTPLIAPHYWLANEACVLTNQSISRFESSTSPVFDIEFIKTIALWFLSCESLISLIFKTLGPKKTKGRSKKLQQKLTWIIQQSTPGTLNRSASGTRAALSEFGRFRNALFHDLHHPNSNPIEFDKSNFCTIPYHLNYADIIEAAPISINTFVLCQHLLPGVNLMPTSLDGNADTEFSSRMFENYKSALSAKGLTTMGVLSLESYSLPPFTDRIFAPIIRSKGAKF